MPCGSHLHNKNNNLPRVFSGSEAEPATKEKKRMMKHNYLTTNHFGGGEFRNFGINLSFSYLYKKTAFIVSKGDNCRLFAFFATESTRYEYVHLIDEAEETATVDTTTLGNQGSSFDFDTCDSEPIEVDLNPQTR